jgi:hypothetical protein
MYAQNEADARRLFKTYQDLKALVPNLNDAQKKQYKRLRKTFTTVVVRVPASGPMSTFAAEIKELTNGNTNSAIVPDGFVKASDGDHDADKVFVYRPELKNNGEIKENSKRTKLFEKLFNNAISDVMIKGTQTTLELSMLENIAKKLVDSGAKEVSDTDRKNKLRSALDVAQVSTEMSFGADAIGRFAVGSKIMAMMSQSEESLVKPIETVIGNQSFTLDEFTTKQLDELAVALQGALDMGKDPVLNELGINKENINTVNVLLMLGVDLESIGIVINNTQEYADLLKQIEPIESAITSLIPVVQLDGKAPQNSTKLRNLMKVFGSIDSGKMPFTTNNFKERPLIKHYKEVMLLQKSLYDSKFFTDDASLVKMYDNMSRYTFNGLSKSQFDKAIFGMISQELIPDVYRNMQGSEVGAMLQSTVNEIESLKKGEIVFTPRSTATFGKKTPTAEQIKVMADKVSKKGVALDKVVALWKGDVQSLKDDINRYIEEEMNTDTSLKDNLFLQYIGIRESTDDLGRVKHKTLYIKQEYKKAQPSEQFEAQEAYKELPKELTEKIGVYQLFTNGVEQKIGSLTEMMPMNIQKAYMNKVQESKNTILQDARSGKIDTVLSRNLMATFSKMDINEKNTMYYKDGDLVMMRNNFGPDKVINNSQFYNGDYFKKYGTKLNNVSLEQHKKLKKC